MTSKATKVVSVRVPLDLYFEILEKTLDNKITMSDYALRLMFRAKDVPQGVDKVSTITIQENNRLKAQFETLQEELRQSNVKLKRVQNQLSECQNNTVPSKSLPYYERMEKERNKLVAFISGKMINHLRLEVPSEIISIMQE